MQNAEERYLKYIFTASEILDLSMKLANKTQDKASIENEKKSVMSQYKSKLDAIGAEISLASSNVSSGYEMRKVQCTIKYHFPEQNKKQITRQDTGEQFVERMTPDDQTLFNQEGLDETSPI